MGMTGEQNRAFKAAVHDLVARVAAALEVAHDDYRVELLTRWDDTHPDTGEPMIGPGVPLSALDKAIANHPGVRHMTAGELAAEAKVGRAVTYLRRLADPAPLDPGPGYGDVGDLMAPTVDLMARRNYARFALHALGYETPNPEQPTKEQT